MGYCIRVAIVSLAVLVSASCAQPSGPGTIDSPSTSASGDSASAAIPSADFPPPYRAASAALVAVAAAFARAVTEYDTSREGRLDFIDRLRSIASKAERQELARSPRGLLPWRILRARSERTRLTINGVTAERSGDATRKVIIEAIVTTHTSFARVSSFRKYTLTLSPHGHDWLVVAAEGLEP
jgi:hypothetical protein